MSTHVKIIMAVGGLILASLVLYYTVLAGPAEPELIVESGGEETPFVETAPPPERARPEPEPARPRQYIDPASMAGATPPTSESTEPVGILTRAVSGQRTAPLSEPVLGSPEPDPPVVSDPLVADPPPATRLAANTPVRVKPPAYSQYVVQDGDSMSSIALSWFGTDARWPLIARANPTIDPDMIHVGDVLRLPPKDGRPVSPPPANAGRDIQTTYIVQSGDTLSHIAKLVYGDGTKWKRIFDANRAALGGDPNRLQVGMRLTLPDGGAVRQ